MRLVAGMASIRRRESSLNLVVHSLAPQLDTLFLYLNDYDHIPAWLGQFKNVIPILSTHALGDIGDSGKFYMLPQSQGQDVYFFTVDDDIIYPPSYIANSILGLARYDGQAICTYHGRLFYDTALPLRGYFNSHLQKQKLLHFNADVYTDETVHFGGTGVMCMDLRHISIPFNIFNKERNAADIFVGCYCQLNKMPIVVLAHRKHWLLPSPLESVQNSIFGTASIIDSPVNIINRELSSHLKKLESFNISNAKGL